MSGPLQLSIYTETNLDQVLALCASEGWNSYTEDRNRAHSVFMAPGVVSVVAVLEGQVAGFAYLQTDGAIQAHLSLLVVADDHRRKGVARSLLTFAAHHLGAHRIDLVTDTGEAFYRSLSHKEQVGFRIYPTD
jgi:ribosomal protein S18 acetylase RimI-like enzyme